MYLPNFKNIQDAYNRIHDFVHRTPVLTCQSLNCLTNAQLFFKCENFQKVGAFKFRGACNAVLQLSETERARGVATHSSGNHAQALALAAKLKNTKAYIIMPNNAHRVKIDAVREYGAKITFCEPTLEAREKKLETIVQQTGAHFVPPYNDARIIAGQGTAAMELLQDEPELDMILVPVGGGGLLSGTAIATSSLSPQTKIIGVEPEQADDAYRSWKSGNLIPVSHPDTIADGLRTSLGTLTFSVIQERVHEIITVSEEAIVAAMKMVWERMKIIIEPSSAVPFAGILEKKIDVQNKRIGIIISGGNVDLKQLPW